MSNRQSAGIILGVMGLLVMALGFLPELVRAQTESAGARQETERGGPRDDLQRSIRYYTYTIIAESGPERGEVLYFYKCWMCHNKYTKSAPYLQDLFRRSKLVNGKPVNENSVAEQIRNGSQRMPGFRYALNDADIADLMAYLRSGKCCYEEDNPPANPWYHKP